MKYIPFFLSIFILFFFSDCNNKEYQHIEGATQGTTYHIIYNNDEMFKPQIDTLLNNFELSLSSFNPNSIISKINNNIEIEIDEYFKTVFNKALEVSKATDGMFDITVAPLVEAYGFYSSEMSNIDKKTKDSLLQFVGYEKVRLENNKIIKNNPKIKIDCNALAQGYTVDVVAYFLEEKGCRNYMIEIGGEILVKGKNEFGNKWRVGIDKPFEQGDEINREIQIILEIENKAIATSGNYRKFYIEDGIKYSHSINPKTGVPIKHNLLSVTILANDCMTADAYATACMVIGLEKAKKLIENHQELEGYFIFSDDKGDFQEYFTEGFNKYIKEE